MTRDGIEYVDYKDSQTLNRYSYVRNNPVSLIDPNGNWMEGDELLPGWAQNIIIDLGIQWELATTDESRDGFHQQAEELRALLREVPLAPPGIDIENNIAEAAKLSAIQFYNKVRNKGDWDFKQQGVEFANFGNFHYGATGSAAGFSPSILLRMAGAAQTRAGTSSPEWGSPLSGPPFGDDPVDQEYIMRGIFYYYSNH